MVKAGEFGRGFAVVAQEVKNLAERSKAATGQVRRTLGNIQKAIQEVVQSAGAGRNTVDAGVSKIEHTGQVIGRLSDTIAETAEA
ncbi:MAG: methyl-accepting chemotaxis protein, partial [Gammaproteobacteria bacterium]